MLRGALIGIAIAASATSAAHATPRERSTPQDVAEELDELIEEQWGEEGVRGEDDADDAVFLRRLSLDLEGVIPTEERVADYLQSRDRDKRIRTLRGMVYGSDYARFMAVRWANLLVGRQNVLRWGGGEAALVRWLSQRIAANTPWDQVVRDLITAEGAAEDNGAAQWLLSFEDRAEEMTGSAMQVFQGLQVQCAQCHDHPYDPNWTQTDFWAVTAFFGRAKRRYDREREVQILEERRNGQVRLPAPPGVEGDLVPPAFFVGADVDGGPGTHRRAALAARITARDNPYFARATVARVWSFFFASGLVHPDDVSMASSFDPVIERLARDFVAHGHDLRRLIEVICSTRAYGIASSGRARDRDAQVDVFARRELRPLSPEQLWASLERVIGLSAWVESFSGERREWAENRHRWLRRRFYTVFLANGEDALDQNTIPQALALINGPLTNAALRLDGEYPNPFMGRLVEERDPLTVLFLRILGRPPERAEQRALSLRNMGSAERAVFLQDVAWALMNSSEFVYNH